MAVGSALHDDLAQRGEAGLLGHAVHDPAAAATAERHGVRALQGLDALDVVEVAVVLHVVAHAVQEEVGGGAVAADDDLVAVVLALVHLDAGGVAQDVAHARHELVADELPGRHGDGLGQVAQEP